MGFAVEALDFKGMGFAVEALDFKGMGFAVEALSLSMRVFDEEIYIYTASAVTLVSFFEARSSLTWSIVD